MLEEGYTRGWAFDIGMDGGGIGISAVIDMLFTSVVSEAFRTASCQLWRSFKANQWLSIIVVCALWLAMSTPTIIKRC